MTYYEHEMRKQSMREAMNMHTEEQRPELHVQSSVLEQLLSTFVDIRFFRGLSLLHVRFSAVRCNPEVLKKGDVSKY